MRLELKATDLEEEKEELQTRLNEQEDQTTACQQVRRSPLLEFNLCRLALSYRPFHCIQFPFIYFKMCDFDGCGLCRFTKFHQVFSPEGYSTYEF